jgi:anti-sigma regulatory factor (Ser/Thr protein kinase)
MTDALQLQLLPNPAAPGAVRDWVDERVAPAVSDGAATALKLMLTELVTNAIVHGDGEVTVRAHVAGDSVQVEVIDAGRRSVPAIREGGDDGGWGLQIVAALASRWGVYEGSTHVWAELPR